MVRPELRAAWRHEYGDHAYPVDSQFASGAGELFTVRGRTIGRNGVLVSAALAVQWNGAFPRTLTTTDSSLAKIMTATFQRPTTG